MKKTWRGEYRRLLQVTADSVVTLDPKTRKITNNFAMADVLSVEVQLGRELVLAVAGGAVAVVGDAAAKGSDEPHAVGDLVIGNALLLTQCLCGAGYQCVQKHVLNSKAYPALAVAAWGYVFGGAMVALVLPIASYENADFWTLPLSSWQPIAYAILLTSAFNYGAQAWANRHSSPTTVTAFFPLQIGFAALFQWVFLGAPPSKWEGVGAAGTIAGLALMVVARRRVAVAAAEAE